jgi:hypothetical protein
MGCRNEGKNARHADENKEMICACRIDTQESAACLNAAAPSISYQYTKYFLITAPLKTPLCSMYRCSYSLLQVVGLVSYRWRPVALKRAEEVLWWNTVHVGHSFGIVCRRRHVTPALLAVPFEHDTCDDQKECEGKSHSKSDKDDESECEMLFCLCVSSAHINWRDWRRMEFDVLFDLKKDCGFSTKTCDKLPGAPWEVEERRNGTREVPLKSTADAVPKLVTFTCPRMRRSCCASIISELAWRSDSMRTWSPRMSVPWPIMSPFTASHLVPSKR